jgi:hypothetical protein
MKQSKNRPHFSIAQIFLYNFAKELNTIGLKEDPQKAVLKKPSIFHIKSFVPAITYKFLKNEAIKKLSLLDERSFLS